MKKLILFFLVIFMSFDGFSQNRKKEIEVDIINHEVQLGESIRMVSRKYKVDPTEIYKLNKDAVNGISEGMILKIPIPKKDGISQVEVKTNAPTQEIVKTNTEKVKVKEDEPIAVIPEKKKVEAVVAIVKRTSETTHTVAAKETLYSISKKYNVGVEEIKVRNPELNDGLKVGQTIKIPSSNGLVSNESANDKTVTPIKVIAKTEKPKVEAVKNETKENVEVKETPKVEVAKTEIKSSSNKHKVEPKETLYSISRDYKVNVEDIKNLNEAVLKDGLKIGQMIQIPDNNGTVVSETENKPKVEKAEEPKISQPNTVTQKSENAQYHIVQPKETKYGIAKQYGMTVQELEQKNPEIIPNLAIGYKLIVSGNSSKTEIVKEVIEKPKPVVTEIIQPEKVETETVTTKKKTSFANYEVKPKETLYSLTQTFSISQDELLSLNPSLKDGVKIGMILKVPGKGSFTKVVSTNTGKFSDLTKSIKSSGARKQLVLLLPFNASKIQADTLKTIGVRLKKDAFLNMTLDFYSGALMAIDSAKTLGLNIDVKIFDSEENKLSSNVENVVRNNNLENADVVIGPFYQQYVEKVAGLLSDKNVPVISPLSKEIGNSYPNLYQAMPPSDFAKSAMFDYMLLKKGNIIIVSDPKKVTNKDFINKKYPDSKFVTFTEKGTLDLENLKSLFVKDKINYVVLDTEKTGMILGTTNKMLNEMTNFQIQLVIIEPNETLDFEEISMKRLTILKMLYPSLTRENNSPEATIFENEYKAKNKIFPNQYATRGFDLTLDTMLRLSQGKTFETSANEDKTQQVESKFEYAKKDAGYVNKGVYIMEYEEDLSVKQVN